MADERRYFKVLGKADNYQLVFPITPFPKFSASVDTITQKVYGIGEVDLGHNKNLIKCSVEGIFPHPNNGYTFTLDDPHVPNFYVKQLQTWMDNQNDLMIEYYTKSERINALNCRIQSFECGEEDGTKNVQYSITFKEYKTIKLNNSSAIVDGMSVAKSYGSSSYFVGEGDTLISIATKLFGDSSKWSYLQNINNLSNPLSLELGQEIKLYK